MIEAKSLRVGNWLISPDTGKPVIIDYTHIGFIDSGQTINGKYYEGIPLSSDILEAIGFEKDGFNNYNFYAHINEYDYRAIVVDLNSGYIWFREGWKERRRSEDSLVTIWNRDYDPYYYLHQLQNAVHALTGKEIEYQPK